MRFGLHQLFGIFQILKVQKSLEKLFLLVQSAKNYYLFGRKKILDRTHYQY